MTIGSKIQIKIGDREFETIEQVLASTYTTGLAKSLVGSRIFWYDDLVVMFPDKQFSSCAMTEIHNGKTITIGYPNSYLSWEAENRKEALTTADQINKRWLSFSGTPSDFLATLEFSTL
jgi:hypothetical protein